MSVPKSQDPIRQQLIEARRNQILDAAIQVFVEKGFHRSTTKEIANTAGVSEGTIYNYFANKSDLVIGIMTRLAQLEGLPDELAQALQDDPRDFLIAIFRHRMGFVRQNLEAIQAVMPEMLISPALRERFYQQFVLPTVTLFEQYIRARVELGHMQVANVPLTVRAVQGMFIGLLVLCILGDEALLSGWDELPEAVATLMFDGPRPQAEEAAE